MTYRPPSSEKSLLSLQSLSPKNRLKAKKVNSEAQTHILYSVYLFFFLLLVSISISTSAYASRLSQTRSSKELASEPLPSEPLPSEPLKPVPSNPSYRRGSVDPIINPGHFDSEQEAIGIIDLNKEILEQCLRYQEIDTASQPDLFTDIRDEDYDNENDPDDDDDDDDDNDDGLNRVDLKEIKFPTEEMVKEGLDWQAKMRKYSYLLGKYILRLPHFNLSLVYNHSLVDNKVTFYPLPDLPPGKLSIRSPGVAYTFEYIADRFIINVDENNKINSIGFH